MNPANPYITVIIPTYNRRKQLEKCLEALSQQTLAQDAFEVIVVNDGSTDDTRKFLDEAETQIDNLSALHQENAGQGNARNYALTRARGQIILFIGDDIYGAKDFLETHAEFHKRNPEPTFACLGLTLWDPNQSINPYMEWLVKGGPQFAYHKLKKGDEAEFWFFYTSNISMKAKPLHMQSFDPDFKGYGWEDIELGYRLQKEEGMRLVYIPQALAYHDHYMTEDFLKKRMRIIGSSAHIFQRKHPELPIIPHFKKRMTLALIGSWPSILILGIFRVIVPRLGRKAYWYALSKRYFLQGLKKL
jgi:glycosyltransferase involved in cell wall biosynthesis